MKDYKNFLQWLICLLMLGNIKFADAQRGIEPEDCKKADFPLNGNLKVLTYRSPTDNTFYGYISGNSINGDKIKANLFKYNSQYPYISGAYFDFGVAVNTTNPEITFAVWDKTNHGYPHNILISKRISLSDIKNDVTSNRETFVGFDNHILLTGDYFIGVILPEKAGDTLALRSNSNGETKPGNAWEQWLDSSWHAYSEHGCWDINISNAIYPQICDQAEGIGKLFISSINSFDVYPNPAKDYIYIKPENAINSKVYINICNVLGNTTKSIQFNELNSNTKIDIKDMSKGIYCIRITSNNLYRTCHLVIQE